MKKIFLLMALPFLVTLIERLLNALVFSKLDLGELPTGIIKASFIIAFILVFLLWSRKDYGMVVPSKYKRLTAILVILLPLTSLFFLFSLQYKGLLSERWIFGWLLWSLCVFREEFILRGVIQTESYTVLKGKLLGISYPILFSSLVFGLWHFVNLSKWSLYVVLIQVLASITLAGLVYGYIREKTGSTIVSFLLHLTTDFFFWTLYLLIFSRPFFEW